MMRSGRASSPDVESSFVDIEGALAALSAEGLRELILDILPWLEEPALGRLINGLMDRAARGDSGWAPDGPTGRDVASIVSFADAAARDGYADPTIVDDYLRCGSNAFFAKDYESAVKIFGVLLAPVGDGDIHLGQYEMVDDVLGVDLAACATQYVVSRYLTAEPERRPDVVFASIQETSGVRYFSRPIGEMEEMSVESLPGLDEFVPQWRELLEEYLTGGGPRDWLAHEKEWLREVVQRLEGAEGLERLARSTKRADDLRAWCHVHVESADWSAALSAFEDAAEIVARRDHARSEFFDGAALAAQELGDPDLPLRHESAWRHAPSMPRLCRWLGSAEDGASLLERAAEALDVCPKRAHRQRAFLHVLLGDHKSAAKLLAAAPGLGWSGEDHPGHLLFTLFRRLLGSGDEEQSPIMSPSYTHERDIDGSDWSGTPPRSPRLTTPEPVDVLKKSGAGALASPQTRTAMLEAMRRAVEKRVDGITSNKRRRYYGQVAELIAVCALADPTPETTRWVNEIRDAYRRYPALRREFERYLGPQ